MKEIALHALDIAQNSTAAQANRLDISLSEGEGQISLTIADNGRGMSPQLLAQVSDPFTTTRTTRKMGLGLPLLRMAAEQTGGVMSIDSTEGVGTTVTAVFSAQHIDCPPVGDMGTTITFLLQGNPDLHLCYRHTVNGRHFLLDTDELHAQLGPDISLAEPEVILWIRDYLQEQELLLRENEEMKT
ncbi:ATP-binding protein [Pseudoflavonifractor phocaeensis]|uniref:ATP-binding protein n=1 Tax=Pseudoflavonifractor phocaeensis TaxID=1870988 RepID=UPI00195F1FFB|nr:ATP-binding protein [Pseudoflavonifractor phocaeensis]MBM6925874.1 sensor histidine kinase [Pseudoflavonifractor phocaeensis]